MRRLLILLLTTALLPLTLTVQATADPIDQTSASPHRKKKVEQTRREWIRLTGEIKRHKRRIVNIRVKNSSAGTPSRSLPVRRSAADYACVVRTNRRGVVAYPPLRVDGSGNSFTHRWLLFVYRVDKARTLGLRDRWHQQFEMCAVGGGHTWNKWAANFSGASVTLSNWRDIRIGQSWGESVYDDGGVHSDLGFKLARGFAEVGGSVPVGIDDAHRFTGTDGYDDHIDLPDGWDSANRVNAYYKAGDDWTFQGTDRHVGNTLQVLYETPQRGTKRLRWILSAKFRAHCTKWWQILGRDCEAFD